MDYYMDLLDSNDSVFIYLDGQMIQIKNMGLGLNH